MARIVRPIKNEPKFKSLKGEKGLSLLITLMMGMVLLAGVTGLLLRS